MTNLIICFSSHSPSSRLLRLGPCEIYYHSFIHCKIMQLKKKTKKQKQKKKTKKTKKQKNKNELDNFQIG